ncbi:hypothetical protein niasHT_014400 [Heterodera trifolii]|uniref:C2H2-type domain-containing protein n=1 Tax=Heterodera trifolii TaxID=157864 RepID=A0ABD2LH85_9BILA
MPSPTPPITLQQNNGASSVSPTMLSSLMHFLQHNKSLWGCSAPNYMPTLAAGMAAQPQQTTAMGVSDNLHTNCAKNGQHHEMVNDVQQNMNGGMDMTTGTSALFAKTVDSLHNFLSPNVVLLPVAFHSLADEQHIQLLGMPQTVIPIAIHPEMQKQFAVRPLLIDQTMAVSHSPQQKQNGRHSGGGTVPKHIGIGRLPTEDNGTTSGGNPPHQLDNVDDNYQFQLPLAFRSSLVHPPTTTAQNVHHHQLLQQPQLNATIPSMECVSVIHPKMEQQFSASVDQFVDGDDDQFKTEPLDLSLSSARTKANENGTMGGNGATVAGGIQRKKRTTNKRQIAEEMCETTGRKAMRKVTPTEAEQKRTSPPSAVGISFSPSVVPPSGTLFTPLASPSSAVSVVPSVVVSSKGPSSACATVTLPVLSPAVDSASRKRFLCDLCGDVSFLAMETLIGHKKYYCRNRLRPDDTSNSSPGANRTVPNGQLAEVAAHASLGLKSIANSSSSSPPSASPPLVQCPHCPFQTATNALLGHHQKQQHSLPVVCAECGYRAFTVRGLRTHARLSHIGATSVVAEQIMPNKKTMAKGNETKNENATTERLKGTDE